MTAFSPAKVNEFSWLRPLLTRCLSKKQTEFISNKKVTKNKETIRKKKNQSISIQVMASGCADTYCARVLVQSARCLLFSGR